MVASPTVLAGKKAFIIEQHVCYRRLLDASKLANYFRANECEVTKNPDEADYLVLFTCAVTDKIEREGFLAMNKLSGHRGELIVMGCLPEIASARFEKTFSGRSLPTRDMDDVDTLFIAEAAPWSAIPEPYDKLEDFPEPCVPSVAENAIDGKRSLGARMRRISFSPRGLTRVLRFVSDRAFSARQKLLGEDTNTYHFRVSRGCKGHCTYCGIKFAIGPLKSRPLGECLRDYRELLEKGRRLFHILAEDVGAYGLDIQSTFADLLEQMSELDHGYPVRWNITELNSVWTVKYRSTLAKVIRSGKLRTLQIAQESGSERILRRIKKYSLTDHIDAAIAEFRKANPMVRISGLFIVGFPSETE
jgi:tRNA A37 methylthiotransferase MiaB